MAPVRLLYYMAPVSQAGESMPWALCSTWPEACLLFASWAASTESSETSFAKLSCHLSVFLPITQERTMGESVLHSSGGKGGRRDHASQLSTPWPFALRVRLQHWPVHARHDYVVPLYMVSRLISSRFSPQCHSYPLGLHFQNWVNSDKDFMCKSHKKHKL